MKAFHVHDSPYLAFPRRACWRQSSLTMRLWRLTLEADAPGCRRMWWDMDQEEDAMGCVTGRGRTGLEVNLPSRRWTRWSDATGADARPSIRGQAEATGRTRLEPTQLGPR